MINKKALPNCGICYLSGIQSEQKNDQFIYRMCKQSQGITDRHHSCDWNKAGYNLIVFTVARNAYREPTADNGTWFSKKVKELGLGSVVESEWTVNYYHKYSGPSDVQGYLWSVDRKAVNKYVAEYEKVHGDPEKQWDRKRESAINAFQQDAAAIAGRAERQADRANPNLARAAYGLGPI